MTDPLVVGALNRAIDIAVTAHQHQVDKAGKPYISHVARVAAKQRNQIRTIVAWLHDVCEDAGEFCSVSDIRKEFGEQIGEAVDAITRRKDESYQDYLLRVKANPIATAVKLADLVDNLEKSRKYGISESLKLRYQRALMFLTGQDEIEEETC